MIGYDDWCENVIKKDTSVKTANDGRWIIESGAWGHAAKVSPRLLTSL